MSDRIEYPGDATIAAISSWLGGSEYDVHLARVLDQFGWFGTFFVRPNDIGKPGMLTQSQLRDILGVGHKVGLLLEGGGDPAAEASALGTLAGVAPWAFARESASTAAPSGLNFGITLREASIRIGPDTDWRDFPVTARSLHAHDELRDRWELVEEGGNGVFHLWGRSSELTDDEDIWADLECNLAWFCGHPHVWYTTLEGLRGG